MKSSEFTSHQIFQQFQKISQKHSLFKDLRRNTFVYQSINDDASFDPNVWMELVVGASTGIMPGGAGNGIGFIISSMLNFGITLRSWLCPWWLKPACCWGWCIGCCFPVVCGKDFGNCDLDGSTLRAFHRSFNAFKAIALRRSLSCWSDGDIDIVSDRSSLELEWFNGIIGWCFTSPTFKLNL